MNSHVRVESIQVRSPSATVSVKRKLPSWFAMAMLVVAGVLTLVWAGLLFWLPGHLVGIW